MSAIPGALAFTPGGNPFAGAGGGLPGLAVDYGNAYNSALNANQSNYNNILAGYQQNYTQLQQGLSAVGNTYGSLMSGISNTLGANYGVPGVNNQWGIAAPAAAAINKLYSSQTGQQFDANGNPTGTPTGGSNMQSLIDRGLGNTSVLDDVNRSSNTDYATSMGSLGANLAQTYAGYQANIGEAYAGQQNAENLALANQGNQQLGFMNSVQIPYPNASLYSSLYQQQGQAAQAAAAQAQQLQIFKMGLGRSGSTTGGVSTPQMPRGGTYGSGGGGFASGGPATSGAVGSTQSGLTPTGFGGTGPQQSPSMYVPTYVGYNPPIDFAPQPQPNAYDPSYDYGDLEVGGGGDF